jgi:L-alanine-DL-glutamate epimerase-like enolase superfamily enzyme
MRITGISYGLLRIPLRTPFKTALRTVEALEDAVIRLETDTGHVGYGEAPPTVAITGDSLEGIFSALRNAIGPALLGRDIVDLESNCTRIQNALPKNTSAKAAAEIALYDLFAQLAGKPLYLVLGGGTPRLSTDLTISVNDTEAMIADCEAAIARGFTALKIKVGRDPATDVGRLKAIYQAIAGRADLRIDANQGWNVPQTLEVMHALESDGMRFDLVEQPVRADDIEGLIAIRAAIRTPVLADESAFNLQQVERLIERGAADIINIKLMKTGGLSQAVAIADHCSANATPCMMGCMLEGGISAAAAAHLAVAKQEIITRIDLDGPTLGTFNPIDSNVLFADSVISISDRPGLGITATSHIHWLD